MLGSELVALSNSACTGKVITSILPEERTTLELWRSSSLFVDGFCWDIIGQDARQIYHTQNMSQVWVEANNQAQVLEKAAVGLA